MNSMKKKTIVANWKMNPNTLGEAEKLFNAIKKKSNKIRSIETVICPPFVYLSELALYYSGSKIKFGAQDVFWEEKGSRTGEVSPLMLKSVGADYCIIGHSERRELGESNEQVSKKVKVALKAGLRVIICVGESERDERATYLSFLKEELQSAFSGVSSKQLKNIYIAYEPIWAIGKSSKEAMQPSQVHEMSLYVKKLLVEKYGKKIALEVPVLYGGSVDSKNVEALFKRGDVDGFLIGRASLDAEMFSEMLQIISKA